MRLPMHNLILMVSLIVAAGGLAETSRADETSEAKIQIQMIVTAAKNYRAELRFGNDIAGYQMI